MNSELYRQIALPTLVGAIVTPVFIQSYRFACRRAGDTASPWPGRVETGSAFIFLFLQIHFILHAAFDRALGLVPVMLVLGGFAACLTRRWRTAAWWLFGLYLGYWLLEKYLFPFGLGVWMESLSPRLDRADHVLHDLAIVGISYIGFKLIHFVVDYRNGDIEKTSVAEFLSWLFFFPSIIAGPMQRYQDWQEQRARRELTIADMSYGIQRIMIGLVLKFLIADTLRVLTLQDMTTTDLTSVPGPRILLGIFAYTIYIYCDFAGYSHIAIGMARFWGIQLPENFRAPFLARNLAEFWNRWHITLSEILRDYLFYPLSLALKRTEFGRNNPIPATILPPLITFLIAGIWHGAGVNFALFGLMHGVGLAYLALAKRRKHSSAFHRWWMKSKAGYGAAVAINFIYVTAAFVFFALPLDKLMVLFHRIAG